MAKKKNPNAVALGKLGGSKGAKIRAAKLTRQNLIVVRFPPKDKD